MADGVRGGRALLPWIALAAPLTAGCEMPLALDPRGPAARGIADVWWVLFWTALAVCVVVFALLAFALVRTRRSDAPLWSPHQGARLVFVAGGVIPVLILTGATAFTLSNLAVFDAPPDGVDRTVTVRGHMFWWEIRYEGEEVVTANELHLPVGRPVEVLLESEDVIHSFWAPQLHGKIEMVPGHTNAIYLQVDEPGVYQGRCAEFCGDQHANMRFLVVAQEPDAFESWLDGQREEAAPPRNELAERGREVFRDAPCARCHTIRGVSQATADAGPDLTHVASRRTLAAGTLPNDRGSLGGWISDPQGLKPGVRMPAVNMPSQDFIALLEYLDGLE